LRTRSSGLRRPATFLAVVVALFGSRLRHWMIPARLKIELSNARGVKGAIYEFDDTTKQARHLTDAIWFHIRVRNETRDTPVSGVHIFLLLIEAPDASGEWKPIFVGNAPLGWTHDKNPLPKTIGYQSAECDLCHVLKQPLEVRLNPINQGQMPDLFRGAFKFVFTLQARGVEAESNKYRVGVSWDGQWSDDQGVMTDHHLVIKPA
jgi:hypothetical protein